MPITVAEGTRVLRAYGAQVKKDVTLSRRPILDGVSISQRGKELQMARKALDALPDVREDRVAEMKKKIADGAIGIESDRIAEKMIFQAVADRLR